MRETLKDLRENTGKTVKEVAKFLGVTIRAIYNYENGIRQIDIKQVLQLAALYGATAEEVIKAQLEVR